MKIYKLALVLSMMFIAVPLTAQEQQKEEKQDVVAKAAAADTLQTRTAIQTAEEIRLDELYLDAQIEKPSVSIVPTRLAPRLDGIEYVIRDFDRELRQIPAELFDFEADRRKFTRIDDIEQILSRARN